MRAIFKFTCLLIIATAFSASSFASTLEAKTASIQKQLAELEASYGGQIGVAAINTANNECIQYRAEQRFPVQSTFKAMAAAAILKQSMTDKQLLQQKLKYNKKDLLFWSPITEKHLADGMTIAGLCAAAVEYSDNAAANLLVKKLGGPQAVTAYARSIGNKAFRLDGWEPNLNSNPHDIYDTSTPAATVNSLQKLVLGNALATSQREQFVSWMKGNAVGDKRIRAGVPKGWIVADKTGSGDYGIANDIGVIWPPKGAPIIVAIYFAKDKKDAPRQEEVIASATHLLVDEFMRKHQL